MQTLFPCITDIHGRSFPYGFEPFKHLNTISGVFCGSILYFFTHELIYLF